MAQGAVNAAWALTLSFFTITPLRRTPHFTMWSGEVMACLTLGFIQVFVTSAESLER